MFLFVIFIVGVAVVPLARGRLGKLADLRFRRLWVLFLAIGLQAMALISPPLPHVVAAAAHVLSYALGGAFLLWNRRLPGFWLVTTGGTLNLIAIVANGGVMPAAPQALAAAGLSNPVIGFTNSVSVVDPNLSFLGDIFALPHTWPLANVFSIGDVLIVLGLVIGIHKAAGSRLIPARSGMLFEVAQHRDFRLLWLAHAGSSVGDWVYALALSAIVVGRSGSGKTLAILLLLQAAGGVVGGLLGGPIVDRLPRRQAMIVSDLVRGLAVASLMLAGKPSLAHLATVAFTLGFMEVVFLSALQAAIPSLVPDRLVVAANGLLTLTFNLALMIGPLLGGLAVASFGFGPALALNALTFGASLALVAAARVPKVEGPVAETPPLRALFEGIRFCMRTPMVRGILVVTAMIMFGVAMRAPIEPVLIMRDLGQGAQGLGLAAAAWGAGMLLGSAIAPIALAGTARSRRVAQAIALAGICVAAAAGASFVALLVLWLVAGVANTVGSIAYESMLQQHTPDALRGRVIAGSEAVMNIATLGGLGLVGLIGEAVGARAIFLVSGVLFVGAGLVSARMVREGAEIAPAKTPA